MFVDEDRVTGKGKENHTSTHEEDDDKTYKSSGSDKKNHHEMDEFEDDRMEYKMKLTWKGGASEMNKAAMLFSQVLAAILYLDPAASMKKKNKDEWLANFVEMVNSPALARKNLEIKQESFKIRKVHTTMYAAIITINSSATINAMKNYYIIRDVLDNENIYMSEYLFTNDAVNERQAGFLANVHIEHVPPQYLISIWRDQLRKYTAEGTEPPEFILKKSKVSTSDGNEQNKWDKFTRAYAVRCDANDKKTLDTLLIKASTDTTWDHRGGTYFPFYWKKKKPEVFDKAVRTTNRCLRNLYVVKISGVSKEIMREKAEKALSTIDRVYDIIPTSKIDTDGEWKILVNVEEKNKGNNQSKGEIHSLIHDDIVSHIAKWPPSWAKMQVIPSVTSKRGNMDNDSDSEGTIASNASILTSAIDDLWGDNEENDSAYNVPEDYGQLRYADAVKRNMQAPTNATHMSPPATNTSEATNDTSEIKKMMHMMLELMQDFKEIKNENAALKQRLFDIESRRPTSLNTPEKGSLSAGEVSSLTPPPLEDFREPKRSCNLQTPETAKVNRVLDIDMQSASTEDDDTTTRQDAWNHVSEGTRLRKRQSEDRGRGRGRGASKRD
jgi:hypothetical protein